MQTEVVTKWKLLSRRKKGRSKTSYGDFFPRCGEGPMNLILLKDASGQWMMGEVEDDAGSTPLINLKWPQLFMERMEDPATGKVFLGLGSPFASFRVPTMLVSWTAMIRLSGLEDNRLYKMYLQAVQQAKGTGLSIPPAK